MIPAELNRSYSYLSQSRCSLQDELDEEAAAHYMWARFCDNTTAHGIPHVTKANGKISYNVGEFTYFREDVRIIFITTGCRDITAAFDSYL